MRTFLVAIAIFGLFATAVRAADDSSPVFGSFPDNARSQKTYLFMLKKNGLAIHTTPDEFCDDLGYGKAVRSSNAEQKGYWKQENKEITDSGSQRVGELDWVICQYPTPPKPPNPQH